LETASWERETDAVHCAAAYGVDITLLIENLRRSPTDRLRRGEKALQSAVSFREEAKRARQRTMRVP
jgi:hypothetical protein